MRILTQDVGSSGETGGLPARRFIAEQGGRQRGTCTAIIQDLLSSGGAPMGLVGFYECEDALETSRALLDAAFSWLAECGVKQVLGPMNVSIWQAYRFMTRGFQQEAFAGEPRNPEFHPDQFEDSGFRPHARYHSWDLTADQLGAIRARAEAKADPGALSAAGLRVTPLDLANFDEQLPQLHSLVVEAFRDNVAFTPLSLPDFRARFAPMRLLARAELAPLVWNAQGEAVGFGYLFPDPVPEGSSDRLIFHTVAVKKEYRRQGMIENVLVELLREAERQGFTRAVGALAKEGPTIYARTGAPSREYTLYSRAL